VGKPLLLVEAGGSYRPGSEDRLTEIMATTLQAHKGYCRLLLTDLGVDEWHSCKVSTQQGFDDQPRLVDIVIYCFDDSGRTLATVFIENKLEGYWFSKGQAQRQHKALQDLEGERGKRVLVGIAEDSDLDRSDSGAKGPLAYSPRLVYDRVLVWSEIVDLAQRAGENYPQLRGGRDWRDRALDPEAAACQRLLYEFVAYLGEEALAAIDGDAVLALKLRDSAVQRGERLLDFAAQATSGFEPNQGKDGSLVWEDETIAGGECWYVAFKPLPDHWLASKEGELDLLIALAEYDDEHPVGEPHVYAGLTFEVDKHDRRKIESASEWKAEAEAQGFCVYTDRREVCIFRGRPLNWIVQEGSTLRDQAKAVADWASEALTAVQQLPPPPEA
jgi:hypothetical protein